MIKQDKHILSLSCPLSPTDKDPCAACDHHHQRRRHRHPRPDGIPISMDNENFHASFACS